MKDPDSPWILRRILVLILIHTVLAWGLQSNKVHVIDYNLEYSAETLNNFLASNNLLALGKQYRTVSVIGP